MFPSNSHDTLVVLDTAKEIFVQEKYQQNQEDYSTLDYYEVGGIHEWLQGGQLKHTFTDETIFTQQFFLLNHLELYRALQYPMETYTESYFLEILNVSTFGIQSNCNSKYEFPIKLQLKFFHNLCILSFGCKQEYHFVSKMLTWLHWKFSYT